MRASWSLTAPPIRRIGEGVWGGGGALWARLHRAVALRRIRVELGFGVGTMELFGIWRSGCQVFRTYTRLSSVL